MCRVKFKQTEIGEIPEDWELKKIGDPEVALVNMGQSPPSKYYSKEKEGLPFYQGNADFGFKHPMPSLYCTKPQKIAEDGDILISVRAPVGEVNIATEKCCIGRGVAAVKPTKGDPYFLYYYLQSIRNAWIIERTTFEAIKKSYLTDKIIPWPSKEEQKKIAAVLATIDNAIEKTEQTIEQFKQVKKGLMQDLLTGRVRFPEFTRALYVQD